MDDQQWSVSEHSDGFDSFIDRNSGKALGTGTGGLRSKSSLKAPQDIAWVHRSIRRRPGEGP
ncbi:hypothetical protein L0U85_00910 [Glycomyces sp. L485]|uniref:hypothetical protein n=1 Tax=Glycomyces sp. L485 TaxID=2909235 RepID=UPI001F4B3CF9|nr:hypothetical protein [Glycomyces sp. L485]MCH7229427.1 hypothetical protein [Glycomyces sp. L485]